MGDIRNHPDEPILGKWTTGTSYIKRCRGCGSLFYGRQNAVYHDEPCRKHYDYLRRKHRRESLDGADERLMTLIEKLQPLLPDDQSSVSMPLSKIEHLGPLLNTFAGVFKHPSDGKNYYVINYNLIWRKEGDQFVLRRKNS